MRTIKTLYTVDELHQLLCQSLGWRYRVRVWIARLQIRWDKWRGQL